MGAENVGDRDGLVSTFSDVDPRMTFSALSINLIFKIRLVSYNNLFFKLSPNVLL